MVKVLFCVWKIKSKKVQEKRGKNALNLPPYCKEPNPQRSIHDLMLNDEDKLRTNQLALGPKVFIGAKKSQDALQN